jgi:hypothetical protein
MATNAETAAILLRQAARFFRDVGGRHPAMEVKLAANADTYEQVADLVEKDPEGAVAAAAANKP